MFGTSSLNLGHTSLSATKVQCSLWSTAQMVRLSLQLARTDKSVFGRTLCTHSLTACYSHIVIPSPSSQPECEVIKGHLGTVRSVDFSRDGSYLLSSSDDKLLKLWKTSDKKFVQSYSSHTNWVRSGVIAPDMRLIASGSDDRSVKLWDFSSGTVVNSYSDHHADAITQLAFHPDGTCLVSAG